MSEAWRHLRVGDRVVLHATGEPGKWEPERLHDQPGTFLGIATTHGYARVRFDAVGGGMPMLVHPESLEREP